MKSILVVAAHPDDEILGCGGTMAAHRAAGDDVHVVILAQGLTSRGAASEAQLEAHRLAGRRANACLGVTSVEFLDFPDNAMDTRPRLAVAQAIENIVGRLRPARIYTHHAGDLNVDHRRAAEAVMTACRPFPGNGSPEILFFEVLSSTGWSSPALLPAFEPNVYRDIAPYLETKLRALREYAHEMREWPHARSYQAVEHLARLRGAMVGRHAAEAFVLGRMIEG